MTIMLDEWFTEDLLMAAAGRRGNHYHQNTAYLWCDPLLRGSLRLRDVAPLRPENALSPIGVGDGGVGRHRRRRRRRRRRRARLAGIGRRDAHIRSRPAHPVAVRASGAESDAPPLGIAAETIRQVLAVDHFSRRSLPFYSRNLSQKKWFHPWFRIGSYHLYFSEPY